MVDPELNYFVVKNAFVERIVLIALVEREMSGMHHKERDPKSKNICCHWIVRFSFPELRRHISISANLGLRDIPYCGKTEIPELDSETRVY